MEILIVSLAAFLAGILNALAGGGSFITLPALVFVGVPPVAANATGTTALLPGYLASVWGFRDLIRTSEVFSLRLLIILGAAGGVFGALLLLITSNAVFRGIVPWLLLFATLLFAFGPSIHAVLSKYQGNTIRPTWAGIGILTVSSYGGYFNGGMGIIILALLRLLGVANLAQANGLKNLLSAVLTLIAVCVYIMGGLIDWSFILFMALAATLGGWTGAHIGRSISQTLLRNIIVTVGALTTLLFFLQAT